MDVTIRFTDTPRVFGALLVPQRTEVVARVGEEAFARALARLPPPMREEYAKLAEDGWCGADTAERVLVEAAREAGIPAAELVDQSVYAAIRRSVGKKWWRALLRMTSDYALLGRTPMFYARSYDRGSLSGERVAPGRDVLVLEGWEDVSELHLVAIAAGVRAVMDLAGRRGVRVGFARDGAHTRFDVLWTP